MGTWSIGIWLAASLSVGIAALPGYDLLAIVEEVVETVEETSESAGTDPVTSSVEEQATPVVDSLEEITEPVDPLVDPVLDPLTGAVDEAVDPITDPGGTEPSVPGSAGDQTPVPDRPHLNDADGGSSAPSSETGPERQPLDGLLGEPLVDESSGVGSGVSSFIERGTEVDDERLAALAEAARLRVAVSAPLEPGSALDGILAWLEDGRGFSRILAAPLELIAVLVRALISAGSGLVAPLTLLAALVVRQLKVIRRDPAAT